MKSKRKGSAGHVAHTGAGDVQGFAGEIWKYLEQVGG